MRLLVLMLLLFPAIVLAWGPNDPTGDIRYSGNGYVGAGGVARGPLYLPDDSGLYLGTGLDCQLTHLSASNATCLVCADVDGAGADGNVLCVNNGTDDVVFGGSGTFAGLTMTGDIAMGGNDITGVADIALDTSTYAIPATLAPTGTTQIIAWASGTVQVLDLGAASGNVTVSFTGAVTGRPLELYVIQSATARTLTWPASVKWPFGVAPTISTANDAVDAIYCRAVDAVQFCGVAQDLK